MESALESVPEMHKVHTKPRKRRWLRFSLRALLVFTALLCAWLGWIMYGIDQQRHAVAVLEKNGAQIRDFSFSAYPPWTSILSRRVHRWIDQALPRELRRVTQVTIQSPDFAEDDLKVLADLPSLRYLSLAGPAVTDASLRYVKPLKSLDCLKLMDSNVTDAGLNGISELTNLEILILSGSPITDAGITHLRGLPKLDELYMSDTPVTGKCLSKLAQIKSLRCLKLDGTYVCGEGLAHLEKMPKLEVVVLKGTPITESDMPFLDGLLKRGRTTVVLDRPLNTLRDQAVQEPSKLLSVPSQ
jgi:Leucine-rich repeat (LRR) protein